MKRKLIIGALICLTFVLSGCGDNKDGGTGLVSRPTKHVSEDDKKTEAVSTEGDVTASTEDDLMTSSSETDTKNESTEVKRKSYKLDSTYAFSEGFAWCTHKVKKNGDSYSVPCVIDREGNVIYEDEERTKYLLYASPFYDGASLICSEKKGITIIDSSGNVLYTLDNTDTEEYTALESYNGISIIKKHVSNMNEDADYVFAVDKNGNTVMDERKMEDTIDGSKVNTSVDSAKKISDGIYSICRTLDVVVIMNLNTKQYIESDKINEGWVHFMDGCLSYDHEIYYFFPEDLENQDTFDKAVDTCFKGADVVDYKYSYLTAEDGIIYYDGFAVDAKTGEKLYDVPQFGKKSKITIVSGGYALIETVGADGNYYYSVCDKSGKAQYDPIKIQDFLFDSGYIYCRDEECIYTPTGEKVALDKVGSIFNEDQMMFLQTNSDIKKYFISGGFINRGNYTSFDGSIVIDKAYLKE